MCSSESTSLGKNVGDLGRKVCWQISHPSALVHTPSRAENKPTTFPTILPLKTLLTCPSGPLAWKRGQSRCYYYSWGTARINWMPDKRWQHNVLRPSWTRTVSTHPLQKKPLSLYLFPKLWLFWCHWDWRQRPLKGYHAHESSSSHATKKKAQQYPLFHGQHITYQMYSIEYLYFAYRRRTRIS